MFLPITMTGRIDECLLLSFRVRAAAVRHLVPTPLELLTHHARGTDWAFFNIVLCHIDRMRPNHLPRAAGLSYHHFAYRLLVRATTLDDRGCSTELRGLYFLRSDVNARLITAPGNALSDFRLNVADLALTADTQTLHARAVTSDRSADLDLSAHLNRLVHHPEDSVFESPEAARTFLKYSPLSMAPAFGGGQLRLAEVHRNESLWNEQPVHLESLRAAFLDPYRPAGLAVELATRVAPIDYRWRLGACAAIA